MIVTAFIIYLQVPVQSHSVSTALHSYATRGVLYATSTYVRDTTGHTCHAYVGTNADMTRLTLWNAIAPGS